jgi:hypothetical protein
MSILTVPNVEESQLTEEDMRAWQFKLFDGTDHGTPSKVDYVIAPCEGRAMEYITGAMGEEYNLADFKPEIQEADLPEGRVMWDHFENN